ncbi:hypothetical protein V7793_08305 [Streptomyces sp. KLMMK]|uniref:hypothetical protein n=1 Tax=Streptomyces sp. KLMMK TaxID=3109353 RepID=UPI0030085930
MGELVGVLDATWKKTTERLGAVGSEAGISIKVRPDGRVKLGRCRQGPDHLQGTA